MLLQYLSLAVTMLWGSQKAAVVLKTKDYAIYKLCSHLTGMSVTTPTG